MSFKSTQYTHTALKLKIKKFTNKQLNKSSHFNIKIINTEQSEIKNLTKFTYANYIK